MNKLLVCWLLGLIALLLGAAMGLSLPWALPLFGQVKQFEARSFFGLLGAMGICGLVGGVLMLIGRRERKAMLFRREAIAVVAFSWLLATLLGAVPYWLSRTATGVDPQGRPVPMDFCEGIFESASGFTCTGATVLGDLENPELVPRAILFWRSETHFLGGLGIMVLFVAVLGLGSAGKALMLTEMPGPSPQSTHARTQHAAWIFAGIFVGLCALLGVLLVLQGMSLFDALCHAFGTVATGGFSTYNKSIEHFHQPGIEMTIAVFMVLGCTNFTLLYFLLRRQPGKLIGDPEFRLYIAIMLLSILLVSGAEWLGGHFARPTTALRYGLFQVVSLQTNTGFGTYDFDQWGGFSKGLLLVLMFIGGCAGSTSCAVKVIRFLIFFKLLWVEIEQVFHPNVVRPVRIGGQPVADPEMLRDVCLYIVLVVVIFVAGTLTLAALEPDSTWLNADRAPREKLVDCASAVAATLNGVGPGLGIVGESENYAAFHGPSKMVLVLMMLLGRLEVFTLLAIFVPRFWRER